MQHGDESSTSMPADSKPDSPEGGACHTWHTRVRSTLENLFGALGAMIGARPWTGLLLGLFVTFLFASGIAMHGVKISTGNLLWIPHETESFEAWQSFQDAFGSFGGKVAGSDTQVLFVRTDGSSLLSPSTLQYIFSVDQYIQKSITDTAGNPLWPVVCDRAAPGTPCDTFSIFTFFGVVNASQLATTNFTDHSRLPDGFVAGSANNPDAFLFTYRGSLASDRFDQMVLFEQVVVAYLTSQANGIDSANGVDIYFLNDELLQQETSKLVEDEYPLIGGTVILILIYMCVVLGGKPFLHSRILLGSTIVITILLALAATFGLAGYIGIKLSVMSPMVIFILLGVGVDDMIIITDSFDRARKHVNVSADATEAEILSKQLSHGLQEAGFAITITSVTSVTAFALASNVDMGAISYFCRLGAVAISTIFLLQVTLFASFLVYDERRIRHRRYDCLVCCHAGPEAADNNTAHTHGSDIELAGVKSQSSTLSVKSMDGPVVKDSEASRQEALRRELAHIQTGKSQSRIQTMLVKYVHPVVVQPRYSLLIVLAFLAFFAVCTAYAISIPTEVDLMEFFAADSPLRQFADNVSLYFGNVRIPFYYVLGPLSYEAASVQQRIFALRDVTLQNQVGFPPYQFWLEDLHIYANASSITLNQTNFYPTLNAFLQAPPFTHPVTGALVFPAGYARDIHRDATGNIQSSRMRFMADWGSALQIRRKSMNSIRDTVASFPDLDGYSFAIQFLYTDRDIVMPKTVITNLGLACAGVVGVLLLLLPFNVVVLLGLCIIIIDTDVIGIVSMSGGTLDITSFSTFTIAIGLSVDYVVHIANEFANLPRSWTVKDRVLITYANMGASVFNGGLSTFLGVCLLAFAKSPAFQTFFRVLFGVTLFGVLHGLVFAIAALVLKNHVLDTCKKRSQNKKAAL